MNNVDKANLAQVAIDAYHAVHPDHADKDGADQETIIDLLTDIQHWIKKEGHNATVIANCSAIAFSCESEA